MINFKQQDEVLPSALILFSILLMLGALAFIWLGKPPTTTSISQSKGRKVYIQINDAKTVSKNILREVRPRLWEGNSETVAVSVLGVLTKVTEANSLKLGAFRPQRTQPLACMIELPYTVQITGQYPGIRALMRTLDSKDSKIALRSVQISSSGEATHEVTASLGLSAYIPGDIISDAIASANSMSDKSRPRGVRRLRQISPGISEGGRHA